MCSPRLSSFVVGALLLSLSGVWAGCHTVWRPLQQCVRAVDCPVDQHCVSALCVPAPQACTDDDGCLVSERCIGGVCRVKGSFPEERALPDAGPRPEPPVVRPDGGVEPAPPEVTKEAPPDQPKEDPRFPKQLNHTPGQGKVIGCVPGTQRRCEGFVSGGVCTPGMTTCAFDGSWEPCRKADDIDLFVQPKERAGELCGDDDDNNCNGVRDEGCFNPFGTTCQMVDTFRYADTPEQLLLDPALLRERPYSSSRKVLLRRRHNSSQQLELVLVDPVKKTAKWLLRLPPLASTFTSYDLSPDGTRVLATTGTSLYIWVLTYDNKGQPAVTHFGTFPRDTVYLVGWGGEQGDHVVLYQNFYDNQARKPNHYVSTWKLNTAADGKLTLDRTKALFVSNTGGLFRFQQASLDIHPSGAYLVLHSYQTGIIYRLPSLEKVHQLDFGSPADPEQRRVAFHPQRPGFVIAPFNYQRHALTVSFDHKAATPDIKTHSTYLIEGVLLSEYLGFDPATGELKAYDGYSPTMSVWPDTPFDKEAKATQRGFATVAAVASTSQPWLFAVSQQGVLRWYSTRDGVLRHEWRAYPAAETKTPLKLGFNDARQELVVVTDTTIETWKVSLGAGKGSATLGQRLATFSSLTANRNKPAIQIQYAADAKWLAVSTDMQIQVWKADSKGMFQKSSHYTAHKGKVQDIAFHPSLPYLASVDTEGQVWLWALEQQAANQLVDDIRDAGNQATVLKGVGFFVPVGQQDDIRLIVTTLETNMHAYYAPADAKGLITIKKQAKSFPLFPGFTDVNVYEAVHHRTSNRFLVRLGARIVTSQQYAITIGTLQLGAKGPDGLAPLESSRSYDKLTPPISDQVRVDMNVNLLTKQHFLISSTDFYGYRCIDQ